MDFSSIDGHRGPQQLPFDLSAQPQSAPNGTTTQSQSQSQPQSQQQSQSPSQSQPRSRPLPQSQPQPQSSQVPQITPTWPERKRRTAASLANCCRTCRLRKVKCTGNPGNGQACSNCDRLELKCPFATSDASNTDKISRVKPSHSHTEAGTVRKRAQRACRQCHSQKTKCSGDLPKCKRCDSIGLNCEYTAAKRKFAGIRQEAIPIPTPTPPTQDSAAPPPTTLHQPTPSSTPLSQPTKSEQSTSPSPFISGSGNGSESKIVNANFPLSIDTSILTAQDLLTRKNITLKNLEAYFEHLYWLPCMGFLHPDTAYRQVYEGTFDAPTAAGLCAITCFFVGETQASKDFGQRCSDEVEFFLFRNMHKFTERVLLPYAFNLSFNFLLGSFAKVWQSFGVAYRLMTGLQLNWDSSTRSKSFFHDELRRRFAWNFFIMDRLLAGGYDEFISIRAENMKIRLPCDEASFWDNKPVVAERLSDKNTKCRGIGLHGLNVRITDLNHRIQAWTKKLAQRTPLEPSKVMEDINNFQSELTRFHLSLPDDIRLSDQSIAKYIPSPERAGYVFLHTHLSVGHIDLYRFALPGILDPKKNDILRRLPKDFVERSKKQAVAHALCTGRFCIAIQNEAEKIQVSKAFLAGDCTIPHMATQSLRVFLIAMQHRIYDNLTEETTAPLWRFQQPNDHYVRSLIEDGLFRVSLPWVPILMTCNVAHAANTAMFAEFNKTQKFADQKGTMGFIGDKPTTGPVTRLPGPHYILENCNYGGIEQEQQRTPDTPVDRWFHRPETQSSSPVAAPYNPAAAAETDFDAQYGPPGVPLLLQVARNTGLEPEAQLEVQHPGMYANDPSMLMSGRMWVAGGMGGPVDGQYLELPAGTTDVPAGSTDGTAPLSMMQMHGTEGMMFPPPPPHPPPNGPPPQPSQQTTTTGALSGSSVALANPTPSQTFIPGQPGLFMNGYTTGYTNEGGHGEAVYMQQTGYE